MKAIYLIRHAKSSWKDMSLNDFDRPLNQRGLENAPRIGKELAKLNCSPDLFICSPAKRTRKTAKLIAKELHFNSKEIQFIDSIYESSLKNLINIISSFPNNKNEILLIGHNPGTTELYNYLTDDDLINIPTCGVVKIEFDIQYWHEIIKGSGLKKFYLYPKML